MRKCGAVVVDVDRFRAQLVLGVRLSCAPLTKHIPNQEQATI